MPVRLDASLLELVLLNLVRNAADAMPDGGQVVIRTCGPRLDGLGDQRAAEVAVSDTGTGNRPGEAARFPLGRVFAALPAHWWRMAGP